MARRHYANAIVSSPAIRFDDWMETLRSQHEGAVPRDQIARTASTVLRKCDPNQYLLSHATIVASVDAYPPRGVKTGRQMLHGTQIDVRWPDYRIKPECHEIINNNCCVPGTMVLMADGTEKPIEDVAVGDEVISHTGSVRRVTQTFTHLQKGWVYEIYSRGDHRPLTLTGEHPVWASRPRRIGARTVDAGEPGWISAGLLRANDLVLSPRLKGGAKVDVTLGKAKLLGYYLAEGHLHRQRLHRVRKGVRDLFPAEAHNVPVGVEFSLCKDENDTLAADIVRLMRDEFGIGVRIGKHSASNNAIKLWTNYAIDAVNFFKKYGGEHARTKRLHPEVLTWPVELQRLVIQGWLEGDGSVKRTAGGWLTVTTSSADLHSGMKILLNRIGCVYSTHRTVRPGRRRVRVEGGGWEIVPDLTKSCTAYTTTVNAIEAEKLVLGSFMEQAWRGARSGKKNHFLEFRATDDGIYQPIKSIERKWYEGTVHNFETEVDHSYVVNTRSVHNSDAWERSLLLSTYRTFLGAQNYLEHIQLPALSKGFVVDAVARDLGKTCYVDILVATDRKHGVLVQDILSGGISALSMGCFVPGTRVTLGDGSLLPIEEIRPDMTVLSQKGNACRVDNLQIRENRWSMRRIKAVGLPVVESTFNHKFYAVPRSELRFERRYGRNLLLPGEYSFEYREAGDILPGDVLATPIPSAVVQPSVSEAEARLLGLWVGDGWKFENKHDSTVGIGLCLDASDEELSSEVERTINSISWRYGEMRATANGGPIPKVVSRSTRRNANYFVSSSRSVRAIVDANVNGRRALDKVIGQDVMSWPESHQLAFLSGIVDSDGCVSTTKHGTKQVFISTRNENLANQYVLMLARCGVVSTLSKVSRRGTKMLPNAAGTDYQVRIRNDGAAKIPALKIRRNADNIRYTPGNSDRWIESGYSYARVKSVDTFQYDGFVYDMQVDGDHSYTANGYGVSNCVSLFTICTKCGNVASDDSQLCPCVMYEGKGREFTDEDGVAHPIAELIGHVSVPNSNQFIEASWVRNPAFRGAVRRNFLNPDQAQVAAKLGEARAVHDLRAEPPLDGLWRAASTRRAQAQGDLEAEFQDQVGDGAADQGGAGQGGSPDQGGSEGQGQAAPPPDPLSDLVQKAQQQLLEILVQGLGDKLAPRPEDVGSVSPSAAGISKNDNLVRAFDRAVAKSFPGQDRLVRWASTAWRIVHVGGPAAVRRARLSAKDLVILSWVEDRINGRELPADLYKAAMSAGPVSSYPSTTSFLAACRVRMGRPLSAQEQASLIRKGRIASIADF